MLAKLGMALSKLGLRASLGEVSVARLIPWPGHLSYNAQAGTVPQVILEYIALVLEGL